MTNQYDKTVRMSDQMNETISAPQYGLLLNFQDYSDGTVKEFDCTFDVKIPDGSTLYIQNKGSGGAEVSNWQGPDHITQSGKLSVKFRMERKGDGIPDPLAVYAINVHDPDRNNVYKTFDLTLEAQAY